MRYSVKRLAGSFQPKIQDAPSIPFLGFMDDSFIEVEFDEDAVTKHVGADGTVTYVLNADKTATLTLSIVQGSVTNDQLSKYVPDARRNYMPVGTLNFADLNGFTLVADTNTVIKKTPKIVFSKGVQGRSWVFILGNAEINAGGDNS